MHFKTLEFAKVGIVLLDKNIKISSPKSMKHDTSHHHCFTWYVYLSFLSSIINNKNKTFVLLSLQTALPSQQKYATTFKEKNTKMLRIDANWKKMYALLIQFNW